jgi:hypothetical protein
MATLNGKKKKARFLCHYHQEEGKHRDLEFGDENSEKTEKANP